MARVKGKQNRATYKSHIYYASDITQPLIISAVTLLTLSYVLSGILSFFETNSSMFEQSLYNIGSFAIKLIFPVLSGAIAYKIASASALVAGISGGIIAGFGISLPYYSSAATTLSGLWGCVISAVVAGYSVLFAKRITRNSKNKLITYVSMYLMPIFCVFLVSVILAQLAGYISVLTSALLAVTSKNNAIITALIIGICLNIDLFGPFHLAAYLFGTASIATGDTKFMACVTAASIVAPLGIGIYHLVFGKEDLKREKTMAYITMSAGILGVPQGAIYHYVRRPLSNIISCITGGAIASILCLLLGCSTDIAAGGFLFIARMQNPLYFVLSVLCGSFASAATLALMQKKENTNTANETDPNKPLQKKPLA